MMAGGVRARTPLAIIGEHSPVTMSPNRLFDPALDAHSPPPRVSARAVGCVVSVNVSAGGVPKLPVNEARLGPQGLAGDSQRLRRIHGGPTRALCLYSLEHIHALQREGHPITPGSTGENITIEGINWLQLAPGARLALGETVVEITSYTEPCGQIKRSFRHSDSTRIDQDQHPGWSRVYARVITQGVIRTGNAARVVGAHATSE